MLAAQTPKNDKDWPNFDTERWIAEKKEDGDRIIIAVNDGPSPEFGLNFLCAWSRYGNFRELNSAIRETLMDLEPGIYDGELVMLGGKSPDVRRIENLGELRLVLFDVLEHVGRSIVHLAWNERRAVLERAATNLHGDRVTLSVPRMIGSRIEAERLKEFTIADGGEGIMLKRAAAPYIIGKRPRNTWVKLKGKGRAVLTVIGFAPSKGEKVNRGPFAMTLLVDNDGLRTSVKTKDNATMQALIAETPEGWTGQGDLFDPPHPAVGRKLEIEFHERHPSGAYREPRWKGWVI